MKESLARWVAVLLAAPLAHAAHAADIEAGKAKVEQVCAACHGAVGVSVSDTIPNLAGQRAAYIETQLKALKEGSRKSPIMNAIASQLSGDDIANVASYFTAQPGVSSASARSNFLPHLAKTGVAFPDNYKSTFSMYYTSNAPALRQVRYYYANPVALQAARDGQPLPNGSMLFSEIYSAKLDADKKPLTGADGFFVPDQLLFYSAMARDAGWGKDIPEMLRNDEWNYGSFTPAKQPRPGVNQAECLACHKPQDKMSYTFTLAQLKSARPRRARSRRPRRRPPATSRRGRS